MPRRLPPGGAAALREQEQRRARLIVALVVIGIAAMLIAYAVSPSVRHEVGKAAHGVTNVFDHHTRDEHSEPKQPPHHPAARHEDHGRSTAPTSTTSGGD